MNVRTILTALAVAAISVVVSAQEAGNTTEQALIDRAPSIATPTEQAGCGLRIRKSWERCTPAEKELYLSAIERSMDDGLYIKFVEIHTEQMTTVEAHGTCMFLYWHRMLLLAFENMLRSYGGAYSCITVPYWDYVTHNAQFLAGRCASLEDCSLILRELGGSSGPTRTVTVNGTPVSGNCVSARPVNHFCEASHLSGPNCARCMPRGDWSSASFPATTSVSSLMRQLFTTLTIDAVASNIEQGIHNTIHNSLSGVMGVLEAPADPIFWSHHASLDLLHSIFYHCAIGNAVPMPLESKISDPRQYVQCARRVQLQTRAVDRAVLLPQSEATFRTGEEGVFPDSVHDPQNPLAPFFASLPVEYESYSDIRDLGPLSYNYEMAGQLATMYTTCADVSSLLRGAAVGGGAVGGATTQRRPGRGVAGVRGGFRQLEQTATGSSLLEAVIVPTAEEAASSSDGWYREALRAAVNASSAIAAKNSAVSATALALREVEKMTCMFYDECRGSINDFSATFRSSFHTNSSTPCTVIVKDVKSGRDAMLVTNWKDIMLQFFTC